MSSLMAACIDTGAGADGMRLPIFCSANSSRAIGYRAPTVDNGSPVRVKDSLRWKPYFSRVSATH